MLAMLERMWMIKFIMVLPQGKAFNASVILHEMYLSPDMLVDVKA